MINCYQPFRMSAEQSDQIETLSLKYKVNKSWLLRYLCEEGLLSYDEKHLRKVARKDPMSVPKIRKKQLRVKR